VGWGHKGEGASFKRLVAAGSAVAGTGSAGPAGRDGSGVPFPRHARPATDDGVAAGPAAEPAGPPPNGATCAAQWPRPGRARSGSPTGSPPATGSPSATWPATRRPARSAYEGRSARQSRTMSRRRYKGSPSQDLSPGGGPGGGGPAGGPGGGPGRAPGGAPGGAPGKRVQEEFQEV